MFNVYTGLRGTGKSNDAVIQIRDYLADGRKAWVNFKVDFRKTYPNLPHENCLLFDDLDDLKYMRGVKGKNNLMVMDEAHWRLNSRSWMKLGTEIPQYIAQSRKLHMDLILISQSFARLDSIARDLTETVREHHKFGGKDDTKPYFFWWKEYDPDKVHLVKRKNLRWKIYRFDKKIADSYNTDELFGDLLKTLPPKEFPKSYISNVMPEKIDKAYVKKTNIITNGIKIQLQTNA